jgi:flagellar hook assembly protein FlgD
MTPTWTISDTPLPTGTAQVPMVLDRNIFRPNQGGAPMAINFKPPQDGHVTVRIFDLEGERVRQPFEADVAAGAWIQAHWDGTNDQGQKAAAGIYFISVQGAGIHSLKKVILLK